MRSAAASPSGVVKTVDIFNATSGVWTTAALSVARYFLAATSLPNEGLAIFAGGVGASYVLMSVIAGVVCGEGEGVWEGRGGLLLPLLIADAKRRFKYPCLQDCGHLQCDERCLDQRQPQRRSI